ncbi:hypothetical protein YY92_08245 [Campylobacter fetus]|uniref:hypothetical protein n=1 Tax=Campylobacter fetus TaxID=196 RepID=UPI0011C7318E|nr:hypothetical protein [Campylobacter fetus]EAJ1232621.1 hypothetical protein [Campylobacter fetus]EAK0414700.1 hypothetical protein [Campylobacter fetus]TXF09184.1 hypothetical protein FPD25_03360 [Campylobacter fetus subsp. fetus]
MKDKIKKLLSKEGYSSPMIRACLNGTRKPNANIRNRLRRFVPFDAWGLKIKEYIQFQEKAKK